MNVPPPLLLLPVIYRGGGGDGCGAQPNFVLFFFFSFSYCRTKERNDVGCCRIYLNIAVSRQCISLPSFHAADDARRTATTTATKTIALWIACCIISWLRRGRAPPSKKKVGRLFSFCRFFVFRPPAAEKERVGGGHKVPRFPPSYLWCSVDMQSYFLRLLSLHFFFLSFAPVASWRNKWINATGTTP